MTVPGLRHRPGAAWLLLAALAAVSGCGRQPAREPPPIVVRYETARPVAETLSQGRTAATQTYLGLIRGETETDLSFRVGGIVEQIGDDRGDWREGERVTEGQELARLQQTDFLAELQRAAAQAEFEGNRYTNNAKLFEERAISQQEWDQIKTTYEKAKADLKRARQASEDSRLLAPFAGTILARLANKGETVMPGRTVLRLADLRAVSVEFGVPDSVVGRIHPNDPLKLWIKAFEGTGLGVIRTGIVTEVGAGAKEGSRLFKVAVRLDNRDGAIKSGMTASVELQNRPNLPTNAVIVRMSALVAASPRLAQGREDRLAVFVIDDQNQARERPVETDDLIRSSVIITDGVASGEKVVVTGAALLYDGARVDPRPDVDGRRP